LLRAAFREVYPSGFRTADVDAILAAAGVTKGALYHHFESKEALGHAVVDEVIAEMNRDKWLRPLRSRLRCDPFCQSPSRGQIWYSRGYPRRRSSRV
jgi:AcrR family transcriptional regulator